MKEKEESGSFIGATITFIFRSLSLSFEVFLRKNIGERYLTIFHLIALFAFYILLVLFTVEKIAAFDEFVVQGFFIVSLVVGIIHIIAAKKRHRKKIEIHSYYSGTPTISKYISNAEEHIIKMYYEPLAIVSWGIVMYYVGQHHYYSVYGLGLYFIGGSIVLFIKGQIEYYIGRNRYLDALDKKIESEMLSEALQGRSPKDTKGFSIPGVKNPSQKDRKKIEEMYRAIDPSLLRLMNQSKELSLENEKDFTHKEPLKNRSKEADKDMER